MALEAIVDGPSNSVKENIRHCTSAKDLWWKLENIYQAKAQDNGANSIEDKMENSAIDEGMNSLENYDCNKFEGNIGDCPLENKERERVNDS